MTDRLGINLSTVMNPQALLSACRNDEIKGIYLMPEVHNPSTCSMTQNYREKVADIVKKHNLFLIEEMDMKVT